MSMTREEAIELLRDTPIDIRSTREDDIYTLYATAQMMAIDALRPVSREQVEKAWRGGWIAVREAGCDPIGGYKCSRCKAEAVLDCNDEFVLDNFCLEWCTIQYNNAYGGRARRSAETQIRNISTGEKAKKIVCVDTGMIFESTKEAERVTGAYHSHISRCCNGKAKTAGGLSWRYA